MNSFHTLNCLRSPWAFAPIEVATIFLASAFYMPIFYLTVGLFLINCVWRLCLELKVSARFRGVMQSSVAAVAYLTFLATLAIAITF